MVAVDAPPLIQKSESDFPICFFQIVHCCALLLDGFFGDAWLE